jgi:EAL domain-containing protein (putative c-di-GMP-specific phosphodiesterase class I)
MTLRAMRIANDMDAGTQATNGYGNGVGLIYLAWHGQIGEMAAKRHVWRTFVEGSFDELSRWSEGRLSMQWLGDDLYLYVRKPDVEAAEFEAWMLGMAGRIRDDWERRARSVLWEEHVDVRIHTGIALVQSSGSDPGQSEWYDAMKRALIHGQMPEAVERSLKRYSFHRIIREQRIYPVYQPIVSLQGEAGFGFEALTRVESGEAFDSPLPLFKFADEEGEHYALDRIARAKAIAHSAIAGSDQKLFINVTARIMDDPHFISGQTLVLLERCGLSPRNVVFELTERTSIEDFGAAKKILDHYRRQGYQIAIDDVGAGYSSLQSIVELRPDYLKVDRSLVENIHQDEMKQHLMSTFVQLASRMSIEVIAEGIERTEELETVRNMGVHYGQGYLLGKPMRRAACDREATLRSVLDGES